MLGSIRMHLSPSRAGTRLEQWREHVRRVEANAVDVVAMQALASLPGSFLPWTRFSMRPAAIVAVLSDIEVYGRQSVMECGSGNSTIYVARLLAQHGHGHITTLEHDEHWASLTRRLLEQEGLERWARVLSAPLVDGWYDRAQIPPVASIDLLVVDGPPAWARERREARQPALDHFASSLTKDASVILDDSRRAGERRVIERWQQTHGRRFRLEPGGFAISAPD